MPFRRISADHRLPRTWSRQQKLCKMLLLESLTFSFFWLWREWVDLLFCLSPFLSCPFLKGYIWFYFPEEGFADVFLCEKHRHWKFLCLLWPLLARAETLSHALRVEKVWRFVSVPKSHSSQYFTQAKVNEKEMLECFSQSNTETLIWL